MIESQLSVEQASDYGLRLTSDQRGLMHGDTEFALVGQILPDPGCCEPTYRSLLVCKDNDCDDCRRVIVPTVVQIAPDEQWKEHFERTKHWRLSADPPFLPRFYGFALDMADMAAAQSCGCYRTGDIACGCSQEIGNLFSPYAAIPITEAQAIAILQAAKERYDNDTKNAFIGFHYLQELHSHTGEFMDCDIEFDSSEMGELIEKEDKHLREAFDLNGAEDHLHITADRVAFTPPEQCQDDAVALTKAQHRHLGKIRSLLKRESPRVLLNERNETFAHPPINDYYHLAFH